MQLLRSHSAIRKSATHNARRAIVFATIVLALSCSAVATAQAPSYVGFDQNLYPGDAMLPLLHHHLSYVGYWLNTPPGSNINTWNGKRDVLRHNGFGFLLLFNSRTDAALKSVDPSVAGRADAALAIAAAYREGFPAHAIVFLDLEDGGRMEENVRNYVAAWVDAVRHSAYRPGVYCSGIEVDDDPGVKISTADDIRTHMGSDVALWIANDECPPSPGCKVSNPGMRMDMSGRKDVLVWQYAQSPRRRQFTSSCAATYAPDGNCYAPGVAHTGRTLLDLDLSNSADPSGGR